MNPRLFAVLRHPSFCACEGYDDDCQCVVHHSVSAFDVEPDECASLPKGDREAVLDIRCEELEPSPGDAGGWMYVEAVTKPCPACAGCADGEMLGCPSCLGSEVVRVRPGVTSADYELGTVEISSVSAEVAA